MKRRSLTKGPPSDPPNKCSRVFGLVAANLGLALNALSERKYDASPCHSFVPDLVTALIENHVSEADLQAAQQSLEQGNQELDRAILSRLTTGGIDISGKPRLFADLDALYASIDEARRTQPSNGDAVL